MRSVSRFFRLTVLPLLALAIANFGLSAPAHAIGIVRDAEIEKLLREYSDPIFVAAGLDPTTVNIYLVNDPTMNAFVAGGRNIFIHTGLILEAERPMELIGVIAHETGHITGGHLARMKDGASSATVPMLVGLGAGIIAALAGAPDVGMALMAGGQHAGYMEFLEFTRTQESAADQASITFMDEAGVSPDGILAFFEKFRYTEVFTHRSGRIPPYWRTHPLSSDRINALASRVENSPNRGKEDSPESVRRFALMQGKLEGFVPEPYVALRLYPQSDHTAEARYARSIAYFRMVEIDKALAEVDSLIEEDPTYPYFYELRGQILFESGRVAEAIPFHQKAVDLDPEEPLLRVNLAQAMIALPDSEDDRANTELAKDNLLFAIARDRNNSFAYQQLAIAYAREGDEGMAALSTAERYYAIGDLAGAASFAGRAQQNLEKGTPGWHRAMDILNVARNVRDDRRGRGYGGSFFQVEPALSTLQGHRG